MTLGSLSWFIEKNPHNLTKPKARHIRIKAPEDYSGDYTHPGYDDIKVTLEEEELFFTYNEITNPLEHWYLVHKENFS